MLTQILRLRNETKNKKRQFLFHPNHVNRSKTFTMNEVKEESPETSLTYFIDEEGRYYYQPGGEGQPLVSIPTSTVTGATQVIGEAQMIIQADSSQTFETVELTPSECKPGEVSFVLVVPDKTNPEIVQLDLKDNKDSDVYVFEEENNVKECSAEEESEVEVKAKCTAKNKRGAPFKPSFTCNFCSYTSHRRYLLLRHMKSHSEERPHKCDICERCFKTFAALQNHLNMHNGVKPHVCKYCKRPFTTSGELVRHVRYKHTHEKPHKCTECDYASVELSKLRRHVRCHTGERPYQCPHCTYASPDTFKLKRHLRIHTGEKPYKCEHCNMSFTQSNSLKTHKLIHNVSEKPEYCCQLCPAKCGRKTDLRNHVQKMHTSPAPLPCKRCGKPFPDKYSCKLHYKTHDGERSFKCNICSYASTSLGPLKSHMYLHTGEKPFTCDECNQCFRQKTLLRRHLNLYHCPEYVPPAPKEKSHECNECERTFARKGNLIRHMTVHDPEFGLKMPEATGQTNFKYIETQHLQSLISSDTDPDLLKLGLTNEEFKRGELVTVEDGEGQQYVVLEVIQLEDGTEHQIAVVTPDMLQEEQEEEEEGAAEGIERTYNVPAKEESQERAANLKKEVDSCFGFDFTTTMASKYWTLEIHGTQQTK